MKKPAKRNPIAKDLGSLKYHKRIVPPKKGKGTSYNRAKMKSGGKKSSDFYFEQIWLTMTKKSFGENHARICYDDRYTRIGEIYIYE